MRVFSTLKPCAKRFLFKIFQGVRILTLFLYLNDVEGGGETRFSNLDINVAPRRGRAILWPSVLNEAPNVKDIRTEHEALTVTNGVKYGVSV